MSWDLLLIRYSRIYAVVDDVPEDERLIPLGTREDIHAAVVASFPGTDWSDPTWGTFEAPGGSVDFDLGEEEPITGLGVHVRATSGVMTFILHLCAAQQWQALDYSDGTFVDQSSSPERNLVGWQAYRDRVVGSSES